LKTIGGTQQICSHFLYTLGKLVDLPIDFLGTIGDALKTKKRGVHGNAPVIVLVYLKRKKSEEEI
jgi:hypothetical protein